MSQNVPVRKKSPSIEAARVVAARVVATRVVAAAIFVAMIFGALWPAEAQSNGEHRLRLGEMAVIEPWTLRFVAVASDNRCPAGAHCIVAGRAVVILELTSAQDPEAHHERSLEIPPGGGDLLLGDLHLRLIVEPETRLDRPIEPSEYELLIKTVSGL